MTRSVELKRRFLCFVFHGKEKNHTISEQHEGEYIFYFWVIYAFNNQLKWNGVSERIILTVNIISEHTGVKTQQNHCAHNWSVTHNKICCLRVTCTELLWDDPLQKDKWIHIKYLLQIIVITKGFILDENILSCLPNYFLIVVFIIIDWLLYLRLIIAIMFVHISGNSLLLSFSITAFVLISETFLVFFIWYIWTLTF